MAYALVSFCVMALAGGQLIFKAVSGRINNLDDILSDGTTLLLFSAAATLYALSTFAWVIVLRTLPLSQAYMFTAAGFVIVPLSAHFIFGENLSTNLMIGGALIVVGIWISSI